MNANTATPLLIMPESNPQFNEFWQAYPRKESKQEALRAFTKAIRTTALPTMLQALQSQCQSQQWAIQKIIPHPATWLNQKRWESEVQPEPTKTAEMSPMMLSIKSKELDRLLEAMRTLKNSYDEHREMTPQDRAKWQEMVADKKALKALLGLKY